MPSGRPKGSKDKGQRKRPKQVIYTKYTEMTYFRTTPETKKLLDGLKEQGVKLSAYLDRLIRRDTKKIKLSTGKVVKKVEYKGKISSTLV
jgi:hypothetical protein